MSHYQDTSRFLASLPACRQAGRRSYLPRQGNSRFPDTLPVLLPPPQNFHFVQIFAGAGVEPASGAYGAPRKTIPNPPARYAHRL